MVRKPGDSLSLSLIWTWQQSDSTPTSETLNEFEMSKNCKLWQWVPINFSMASEHTFFTTNDMRLEADVKTFLEGKKSKFFKPVTNKLYWLIKRRTSKTRLYNLLAAGYTRNFLRAFKKVICIKLKKGKKLFR